MPGVPRCGGNVWLRQITFGVWLTGGVAIEWFGDSTFTPLVTAVTATPTVSRSNPCQTTLTSRPNAQQKF
jgi:hypothetical protein